MKLRIALFALVLASVFACNKYKVSTTEDGDRIVYHEKGKSKRLPKEGDIINFDLEIKTAKDSVLQSSYKQGVPITAPLMKGQFKGSFENGLFHISEGDSATVLVKADTLFKYIGQPVPVEIGAGSDIHFVVRMHKVQSEEERKKEIADNKANEPKYIKEYVAKNMKNALQTTTGGIHYVENTVGTGPQVQAGDTVEVAYVGKFMDHKIFDQSSFPLVVDAPGIIPGWGIALKTMKVGGKSTFIIPSELGYGEMGSGPIAPNTPLVFEITVKEKK